MSEFQQLGAADSRSIDQLVATYSVVGQRQRRQQRTRRAAYAAATIVAVGVVALIVETAPRVGTSIGTTASTGVGDNEERGVQQEHLAAKLATLEQQVAALQRQRNDIVGQQVVLAERAADLDRRQQQGALLEQEIEAISAQRQALEQRWAQFDAQGELLMTEIMAVNAQRKELDAQRRQLDRHRKELAELLDQASRLHRQDASNDTERPREDTGATTERRDDFGITYESLLVDNTLLEEMRGGFSIGEGMDVSFGFTQTGYLNGVEQFRNNFTINNMASGLDDIDMSNMGATLVQSGTGNFVSANVLDSMSDSFANIVQNTLDDQVIATTTVFDFSLSNVPGALQGMAGEQALLDSLGSF